MDKKMRAALAALAGLLAAAGAWAAELPNGVEADVLGTTEDEEGRVVAARVAGSVRVETKFGTFATQPDSEIRFHGNGGVMSFVLAEKAEASLPCGTFVISSARGRPVELYEDGGLKSAYLPDFFAGRNDTRNVASTKAGSFQVRDKDTVSFFGDGSLAAARVRSGSEIDFGGSRTRLAANSRIAFREDGSLAEFSPSDSVVCHGVKSRGGRPISLGEDGSVLSFIPARGETFVIDGEAFRFVDGEPVEMHGTGKVRRLALDFEGKDLALGGTRILCRTRERTLQDGNPRLLYRSGGLSRPSESKEIALSFRDDGSLSSAESLSERGEFIFGFGNGEFAAANAIFLHPNGRLARVHYSGAVVVADGDNPAARHWLEFRRDFFGEDGRLYARLGSEWTKSDRGGFRDTAKTALLLMDGMRLVYDGDFSDAAVEAAYGGKK